VILIVVACLVAVVVAFLVRPGEREPEYQGKKLSAWLEIRNRETGQTPSEYERANEAIRQIGTNALPYLLRWIRDDPNPRRTRLMVVVERWLPARLRRIYGVGHDLAERRRVWAIQCFFGLGESATSAIPDLVQLMNDTNSPSVSAAAMHALACVGKPSLPHLLAVLSDSNRVDRAEAANWIANFADHYGTNGIVAVPVLVKCLQGNDTRVAGESAGALSRLYLDPEVVLPALVSGLASTNPVTRLCCVSALEAMGDRRGRGAVAALLNMRDDPDREVRVAVPIALRAIVPEMAATNRISKAEAKQ
jgi:hypothetical protein